MCGRKSERDKKGRNVVASCVAICIVAAIIGSSIIAGSAAEQTSDTVTVTVNASEIVNETFNASIDVDSITDFSAGLLELSFNASVVNVTDVANGSLGGETIVVDTWGFLDNDTILISVISGASGTAGVNGIGNLTTISFEVVGKSGDRSVLNMSDDGILVNPEGERIPTVWVDDEVVVEE